VNSFYQADVSMHAGARAGNNSPQIAPPTGAPAITVPMGFLFNVCRSPLPAGIQFLARPWEEGTLLKLAYAYEQATQHRACARPPLPVPAVRVRRGWPGEHVGAMKPALRSWWLGYLPSVAPALCLDRYAIAA
jgi:hypothetical protein